MALQAPVMNEFHMVNERLFAIPEVERVFIKSSKSTLDVTIIVPDSNPAVLDKLAAVELGVINTFPWIKVDFDIIFRSGRSLSDLVVPKGSLLFAR